MLSVSYQVLEFLTSYDWLLLTSCHRAKFSWDKLSLRHEIGSSWVICRCFDRKWIGAKLFPLPSIQNHFSPDLFWSDTVGELILVFDRACCLEMLLLPMLLLLLLLSRVRCRHINQVKQLAPVAASEPWKKVPLIIPILSVLATKRQSFEMGLILKSCLTL